MRVIRLGTRGSALARWQSEHVAARVCGLDASLTVNLVEISSQGDVLTEVPLSHVEGTGFFTSALEEALLAGEIDLAVHSYKDLPVDPTPALVVAAVPPRAPAEDVVCARDGLTVARLPRDARVGTCSTRRAAQLAAMRRDLTLVTLRGNVPTRVQKVVTGELDAVVLARAGLVRLGLERHVTEVFSFDRMLPAPAQGALAVQCREGDDWLRGVLAPLDHQPTRSAVDAERMLLHALGGGCSVPVGAHAEWNGNRLQLTAGVFHPETDRSVVVRMTGEDAGQLAVAAARRLLAQGAEEVLAAFSKTPPAAVLPGERA
jgi:hydroxymethylbilane synthase